MVADCTDPTLRHIIRLAVDGLWYDDMMSRAHCFSETERADIIDRLVEMSRRC